MYERHSEAVGLVAAPSDEVFARLDDHSRLAGHMSKSSWRLGGGQMSITVDEGRGQRVGSHIRLVGRVFGIELFVDEVVTVREPPLRKVWRTIETPRLLVIGPYQMGFQLTSVGAMSNLLVHIDYDIPPSGLPRILGHLFGAWYARWCTQKMVQDAIAAYSPRPPRSPPHGAAV